jgi:hypothetical protein
MLTAMLMHGVWNASGAIGGDSAFGWIVPLTVSAVLIATIVWVYDNSVPIERAWMRDLMAPEVKLGVVAPAELDALAGTRQALRSYVRSQPDGHRAERVLEAETELARQIARDNGVETAAVQQARSAVAQARLA